MSEPQLRMEKHDLQRVPEIVLPEGYALRTFVHGDVAGLSRVYAASDLGCATPDLVRDRILEREYFRPQRLFVVEWEGELVGTAIAWEEAGEPPVGYLHMVGVMPEHRGKGLGAALTVAAIRQNLREGFTVQRLDTDDNREAALRLYLGLGYRPLISHDSHPNRWARVAARLGVSALPECSRTEI